MQLSLRYIILYVEDGERSLHFYRDLLKLPVKGEHETYIEFDTGSTILAINTKESVREITGLTVPDRGAATYEIGFVVEQVQETIDYLRANGVPVVVEPTEKPWGQTVAYVTDPDGNLIEICTPMG